MPYVRISLALALIGVALTSLPAADSLTRKSNNKPVTGKITNQTKTEVVVKPSVGADITVSANDITNVDWDGAPPELRINRSLEASGRYDAALEKYNELLAAAGNDNVRTELEFLIARTTARQSLADPDKADEAASLLEKFAQKHSNNYRFYESRKWLGDVYLAAKQFDKAESAFNDLSSSPWTDFQMDGNLFKARLLLERNDPSGAKQLFDKVAASDSSSPAEQARKYQAILGQARCLVAQNSLSDAVAALESLIEQLPQDLTELQAETYLRHGDVLSLMEGRQKDALLAYLHVDVVPSLAVHKSLHAEALFHLATLWPATGDSTGRGDEARARLTSLYPNSEWTKKLAAAK